MRSDKLEPITALRVCSDNFTSAMETVRLLGDNMLLVQGGQSVVEPEGLAVLYLKDDTDEVMLPDTYQEKPGMEGDEKATCMGETEESERG